MTFEQWWKQHKNKTDNGEGRKGEFYFEDVKAAFEAGQETLIQKIVHHQDLGAEDEKSLRFIMEEMP